MKDMLLMGPQQEKLVSHIFAPMTLATVLAFKVAHLWIEQFTVINFDDNDAI